VQVILLVIVVVAVGGAYYFGKLSNKQNVVETTTEEPVAMETSETSPDWKLYQGDGFSFRYPGSIFLKTDLTGLLVAYPEDKKDDPYFEQNYSDFYISKTFTQQNQNFESAIKEAGIYFKPYSEFQSIKMQNGIVRMSGLLNGKKTIRGFYNYEGKAFEITYWERDWSVTPETFDQILSTFRFTK
jgi:hypothetical protein